MGERVDLDELERKARAVVGPWYTSCDYPLADMRTARAEYVIAASPQVVLALIAHIRDLDAGMAALIRSASPNPIDHPTMAAAWKMAQELLGKGTVMT